MQLKSMPLLVLAAQVCPANVEGTLFAFIMGMNNTGSSYAGYFGGWLNDALGLNLNDFVGTATANALRFFMKLSPIFFLYLVPDQNPKEVIAQIDADLKRSEDSELSGGAPASKWDLSGWAMLAVFFLIQIWIPLIEGLQLSYTWCVVPVILLAGVPAYQIYYRDVEKSGSADGLNSSLTGSAVDNDFIQLEAPSMSTESQSQSVNPIPHGHAGFSMEPGMPPPAASVTAL